MNRICCFGLGLLLSISSASADDWPMWRFDAGRTAASTNELPDELHLQWQRELSPRKQAWDDALNLDLMTYDRIFEPIVMDGRLFVGFNDRDKLTAFDAESGVELWSVFAGGPVRLPPVGWNGNVFFSSDDGCLYCVDAKDGQVRWKFSGAPNEQHVIGNRRLISAWPARGGPVVRDGTVYFAASIWPFMGTFIYALDAETGEVEWVNDNTGSQYIKQPHSAPSFAGVAPQGSLVATKDALIVPGGRSVPAVFNRADGSLRYFEINAGGKGTGGSFVTADEKQFYVHTRRKGTRAFGIKVGRKTAFMPSNPVLYKGRVYSAGTDDETNVVRAYDESEKIAWEIAVDATGDLILSGGKLIAAGAAAITVIQLPKGDRPARIVKTIPMDKKVERLLVADETLFAVTLDGHILAYGKPKTLAAGLDREPKEYRELGPRLASTDHENGNTGAGERDADANRIVTELLATGDATGYALWYGDSRMPLVNALAEKSPFIELTIIDGNADVVQDSRNRLDRAGLYGRVTVHHSAAATFRAPKYIANMVFVDEHAITSNEARGIAEIYESVRPYGGAMHVLCNEGKEALAARINALELEQATVSVGDHSVMVRRVGALPGSADWTHQYGDVANTVKSNDSRVKLPLGVLWFGGNSNEDTLPRHGHGPPEQVIGGRLFIQGMNSLSARDVYTGRPLWKRRFKDLGTFDVYYDHTHELTPLDSKYNQVHIPGANGRGTNYVVTEDRIYIVEGSVCHVLDPATGETLTDIVLPKIDSARTENWGYIGVYKDVLIGGMGFADYKNRRGLSFESDGDLKSRQSGFGSKSFGRAASMVLVVFDRHSGQLLWKADAHHSFWHNGIVAGGDRIYCLDRNPAEVELAMRRRGIPNPDSYRIVALDYRTGRPQWQITEDIFGTWLGYSEEHKLLLQAGAAASDRLRGESKTGMAVYNAGDGSVKWKNLSLDYSGPCILHNDLIITNANSYRESKGAFYLETGEQRLVRNPITGKMQPWKLTRAYGCNNIIASENLLTFRSGAAGFYDLLSDTGTGNLGGFKSGCTSNLVVAGGVLNAPDYTRTCSCAYQNQTSLALVHMPDLDVWSVNTAASTGSYGSLIESIGINFGAPGDRRDAEGRLWFEYPAIAEPSPPISIEINSGAKFYQQHTSALSGAELPWIMASGVQGVTDMRIRLQMDPEHNLLTGVPISHQDDDAEENEQGDVNLASSDLELVQDSGRQLVGIRFNDILLPQNAKIKNAHIQFTCDETTSDPTSLIIAVEDSGNAGRFSKDQHDLSSRSRSSKEVGWQPPAWPKSGASDKLHKTPDLASLIDAVTSRSDWKPGNSIVFLFTGSGNRIASAWSDKKRSAKLVVDSDDTLKPKNANSPEKNYRVRLLFGAALKTDSSDAIFDVLLQGKRVVQDLRISPKGENGPKSATHTFDDVVATGELHIQLVPKQGQPVLSGIEIVNSDRE